MTQAARALPMAGGNARAANGVPSAVPAAGGSAGVSYLRAVVTTACPLRCAYCHAEGDPRRPGERDRLPAPVLAALLVAGIRAGTRKLKYLGGEPLLRRDLPEVTRVVRRESQTLDISLITGGVADPDRIGELFESGLSRANLSVHGWTPEAFELRGGSARAHALRARVLERLVASGRPCKLNYVVAADLDEGDLGRLLASAAGSGLVVGLLDDLGDPDASAASLLRLLDRLAGTPEASWAEPDPDSLPTTRMRWPSGLEVEIKTERLGAHAPWRACRLCAARVRCREGIRALRLTHDGSLQPCMDRPDLRLPLLPLLESGGIEAVVEGWRRWVARAAARVTEAA